MTAFTTLSVVLSIATGRIIQFLMWYDFIGGLVVARKSYFLIRNSVIMHINIVAILRLILLKYPIFNFQTITQPILINLFNNKYIYIYMCELLLLTQSHTNVIVLIFSDWHYRLVVVLEITRHVTLHAQKEKSTQLQHIYIYIVYYILRSFN